MSVRLLVVSEYRSLTLLPASGPDSPGKTVRQNVSSLVRDIEEAIPAKTPRDRRVIYHHRRKQSPAESIAKYVAELRRLGTRYKFGEYLNDVLRDRLVCGLSNNNIQKLLLSEAKLVTYTRAVEMV